MAEPKLESLIADLKAKEFRLTDIIMDGKEEIEASKLLQVLTFFENPYVEATIEAIKKEDAPAQKIIVKNLMELYPLSQKVVVGVLERIPQADTYVIDGFDLSEQVCKKQIAILDKIQKATPYSGRNGMTKRFSEYEKQIKELERKLTEMRGTVAKDSSYRQKIAKLEQERASLEKQLSAETKENNLQAKRREITELRDKIAKHKAENEFIEKTWQDLRAELKTLAGKLTSSEEETLLRQLVEKFPKDEGEEQ